MVARALLRLMDVDETGTHAHGAAFISRGLLGPERCISRCNHLNPVEPWTLAL
jgi:hypothetical protein